MAGKRETGLSRSFKVDRSKIDTAKRTVELAFSSEEPVERWGENEVLSHARGDYDFDRLNDSHPLLLGHDESDPTTQIGVIESARCDSDMVGRAVVRFGKSPLADEIFQDVVDGIRQLVSVGYDRTGIVSSNKAADGMVTTRYRWMATHIAIVPVPADATVGVGRKKPSEVDSPEFSNVEQLAQRLTPEQRTAMKRHLTLLDPAPAPTAPAGGGAAPAAPAVQSVDETKVRALERDRARQIRNITEELLRDHGTKLGSDGKPLAETIRRIESESLANDTSLGDFQIRAMKEVIGAKPAKPILMRDFASEQEVNRYSLLRGVQAAVRARLAGKEGLPDGLEREAHDEFIRRSNANGGLGYEPGGFIVPPDAPLNMNALRGRERSRLQRDMQATVFAGGGAFVPTQLLVPVIELLRNKMVLDRAGIRRMAGLQGNIVIPRQEAAATAYSVSEIGALTASQQLLGQIALSPHRVGATQNYSKQFIMQSTPDAEAFMRDDLFKVIALKWDYLGLAGNGAGDEPLGIINAPGISSIIFGATPTYAKIIAMQTALRKANVLGDLAYISTPGTEGSLRTVAVTLTGATTVVGGADNAIWAPAGADDEDGMVAGHPAHATNQVPSDLVILGEFDQLIQGLWGGLDVVVDYFTKAVNAEVALTINTWGDFALRHPQAFCVSADSGAQ